MMDQLATLFWLKWRLFRNALRSRRAAAGSVAAAVATLAVLALALLAAVGLGFLSYSLAVMDPRAGAAGALDPAATPNLLTFTIFASIYLMWVVLPLGLGGGARFDTGRLLLYPISLHRLFAIDLLSELTSLASLIAVPLILGVSIGIGLATGDLPAALLVAASAVALGVTFAKWLSIALGSLMHKGRTRGETVLALVGAAVGLGGALLGQLVPVIAAHRAALGALRWTPPGAATVALAAGSTASGSQAYLLGLLTLWTYTLVFAVAAYFIARRQALGMGRATGPAGRRQLVEGGPYAGWQFPFISAQLSAVLEKELRYAMRNAQLKTVALMPLILLIARMAGPTSSGSGRPVSSAPGHHAAAGFSRYSDGLMTAGGLLYVFMILSPLACNLFGYEGDGMRSLILAPVEGRTVLAGKNIAVTIVALVPALALLVIDQMVFGDLSFGSLVFTAICFPLFASLFALMGNWLSMRFPKRLRFGKRMNASGITGLLLIPVLVVLAIPPSTAILAGYLMESLLVKYVTLVLFATGALALYFVAIDKQGNALARMQIEILETVSERTGET